MHRLHRNGGRIDEGVLETGKGVVLATATNIAGFGTLTLGNYPALRSLGVMALIGSITCLLTALMLVPALMAGRRQQPGEPPVWYSTADDGTSGLRRPRPEQALSHGPGHGRGAARRRPPGLGGRGARGRGAVGLGQEHAPPPAGTLDEPDAGALDDRRDPGLVDGRGRTHGVPAYPARFRLPDFQLAAGALRPENVELLWLAGVSSGERRRRAHEALAEVGLGARRGHRPDQLSGGEWQRVAIARALVHRPLAVLADEPTGNLDSGTAAEVMELLMSLNRAHGTVFVIATHDAALIARAPRRVALHDGRVASDERKASA